jgi:hypothetical protein
MIYNLLQRTRGIVAPSGIIIEEDFRNEKGFFGKVPEFSKFEENLAFRAVVFHIGKSACRFLRIISQ